MKPFFALVLGLFLLGCTTPPAPKPEQKPAVDSAALGESGVAAFQQVVKRMEPIAEAECRRMTQGVNCDFDIRVDRNPKSPANALQTEDRNGRPIIIFSEKLLAKSRNVDEIAFVLGHEAAHHIQGHLQQTKRNAIAGAMILSGIAAASGANPSQIERALKAGAIVGARQYSVDFELEADALGTKITMKSGYSAVRGAEFFNRIPDPKDRFLATHPPNAKRIETVRRTAARFNR